MVAARLAAWNPGVEAGLERRGGRPFEFVFGLSRMVTGYEPGNVVHVTSVLDAVYQVGNSLAHACNPPATAKTFGIRPIHCKPMRYGPGTISGSDILAEGALQEVVGDPLGTALLSGPELAIGDIDGYGPGRHQYNSPNQLVGTVRAGVDIRFCPGMRGPRSAPVRFRP